MLFLFKVAVLGLKIKMAQFEIIINNFINNFKHKDAWIESVYRFGVIFIFIKKVTSKN